MPVQGTGIRSNATAGGCCQADLIDFADNDAFDALVFENLAKGPTVAATDDKHLVIMVIMQSITSEVWPLLVFFLDFVNLITGSPRSRSRPSWRSGDQAHKVEPFRHFTIKGR